MKLLYNKPVKGGRIFLYKNNDGTYLIKYVSGGRPVVIGRGNSLKEAKNDFRKRYNFYKSNLNKKKQTNIPNNIMFGEQVDKYFNLNDKLIRQYVNKRNNTLAKIFLKNFLTEAKRNPNLTMTRRDEILANTLQKYLGKNVWELAKNNSKYYNLIDDIYNKAFSMLQNSLRKKGKNISTWADFLKIISRQQPPKQQPPKQQPQPVKLQNNQGPTIKQANKIIDTAKQLDINKKIKTLEKAEQLFKQKGRDDLALATQMLKNQLQYANEVKGNLLESYKQLIDILHQQGSNLASDYGKSKQFIESVITNKLGDIESKLQNLNKIVEDNYQNQLQRIKQIINKQTNIAEGRQRKGEVSRAQAYATQASIEQDYLKQLQNASKDYYNQLRQNVLDYSNLYKTWINELQQTQNTWEKSLYDKLYNTAVSSYKGLQTLNERLDKDILNNMNIATQTLGQLSTTAKSQQLTEEQIRNK